MNTLSASVMSAIFAAAVAVVVPPAPAQPAQPSAPTPLRPPAIPLVVHNPYFSTWSMGDKLTDSWPRHWSGGNNGMAGLARIDGRTFRWCGPQIPGIDAANAAMKQTALDITATKSAFTFEQSGVKLEVSFLSPVLAGDLELASRPVTYLTVAATSTDGKDHEVSIYLDVSAEWCVHSNDQFVRWTRAKLGGSEPIELLSFASQDQPVLKRAGDSIKIDWGQFYLAVASSPRVQTVIAGHETARRGFASAGTLADSDDLRQPRAASDDWPVIAAVSNLGTVKASGNAAAASETFYLAYDEGYAMEYMGRKLRPYWNRANRGFGPMLAEAIRSRATVMEECKRFDATLRERLVASCGSKLAAVNELAYRQTMAAHGLGADFDGTPLMFAKENTSNGCIGTVDVIFPTAPFFLALNPDLLMAQLRPVMDYASSPRWTFAFAPHDLGTYPLANGQVYGGGERTQQDQMPVEECGNMLILLGAVAKQQNNAEPLRKWWPALTKWAEYLRDNGLDPAEQLCTDDFAGHLARNANLAVKATVGVGSYAMLCGMLGDESAATRWRAEAQRMATEWQRLAAGKDATVLAYEKPETWSLKYNLVWDRVLALNLFPADVARKEIAFYKTKNAKYGVPMDNRAAYTKGEWIVWSACMAEKREDFEKLVSPIYQMAQETKDRVPLTDWFDTVNAKTMGMHTRSVVGGMYMPLIMPKP